MKCRWCGEIFEGVILIEDVCLACIIEDVVDVNLIKDDD